MSTYTPVSKVIGATGASGAAGFINLVAAFNTAVATAVTTAQAVTGVSPQSITVSPGLLNVDTNSVIFEMYSTVSYTVVT